MPQQPGLILTPTQLAMIRNRIANQTATAADIGASRSWLAQLLAGRFNPSEDLLRRLCDALDLDLSVRTVVRIGQKAKPRAAHSSPGD